MPENGSFRGSVFYLNPTIFDPSIQNKDCKHKITID